MRFEACLNHFCGLLPVHLVRPTDEPMEPNWRGPSPISSSTGTIGTNCWWKTPEDLIGSNITRISFSYGGCIFSIRWVSDFLKISLNNIDVPVLSQKSVVSWMSLFPCTISRFIGRFLWMSWCPLYMYKAFYIQCGH